MKTIVAAGLSLSALFLFDEALCMALPLESTPLADCGYSLFCLVQAVAALVLLAARRPDRQLLRPAALAVEGAVMIAGSLLAFAPLPEGPAGSALILAGFCAAAAAALAAKGASLLALAHRAPDQVRIVVVAIILARLFGMLLPMADPATALALIVVCGILGVAPTALMGGRLSLDATGPRVHIERKSISPVTAGFVILCAGCSFMSPISGDPALNFTRDFPFTGEVDWIVTQLAVAAIVGLLLFAVRDFCYGTSARVTSTIVVAAFMLYMALGEVRPSFELSLIALTVLEFMALYAMVDYASYADFPPHRILFGYLAAFNFAVTLGSASGLGDSVLHPLFGTVTVLGLLMCLLVAAAPIWLLTQATLDAFFWGRPIVPSGADGHHPNGFPAVDSSEEASHEDPGNQQEDRPEEQPAEGGTESLERNVRDIAESYRLTAREEEILGLLVQGRSSTFIAEQLYLSPNTVRTHIARIYTKCDIHSKQEMLTLAQTYQPKEAPRTA